MSQTALLEQAKTAVENYIKNNRGFDPEQLIFNFFNHTDAPDWQEAIFDYHTMTEQLVSAFADKQINQRFYELFPYARVVKPLHCLLDFFTTFFHSDFLQANFQLFVLTHFYNTVDENDLKSIIDEYSKKA